jgi:hypothetical protein
MEKITCIDRVRNEEVLHRVKEERNILLSIKGRKANWIGQILRGNCFLEHVIEGRVKGRIDVTERRGRTRRQILHELKKLRGSWKLNEEALDRTLCRTRFGRVYGPVIRQTTERMTNRCCHKVCGHSINAVTGSNPAES